MNSLQPIIIVQSSPTKQTAIDLAGAARDRNYDIQDISFSRQQEQPPLIDGKFPVFIYGSVALIRDWCSKYEALNDWVWYDHERLGPACWKKHLGSHFLNSDGKRVFAKDFRAQYFPVGETWHVRPMLNDKKPVGGLYSFDDIEIRNLNDGCELWVSMPKPIMDEVRVWIVGSQPCTASQYRANKKLVNLTGNVTILHAMNYAAIVANVFLPHEHCVMDLARDFEGNWSVIEFNPIHGSGWYGADPGEILEAFVSFYS